MNYGSRALRFGILLVLSLCVIVLAPMWGAVDISVVDMLRGDLPAGQEKIIYELRLPRVLLAFLAGATLALSGLVFQSLLRNPLATPFTLGVASGASLGSAIFIQTGLTLTFLGLSGATWFAFAGAVGATALVYSIAMALKRRDNVTLLLAGVAVSFFFSSVILFLQYLADFTAVFKMLRWIMGGLEVVGYAEVARILPFTLIGAGLIMWKSPELNLISSGEDMAHSRGVNVARVRRSMFLGISILVGAVVSLTGPIAFVGMMVPHICRLIFGADNRILTPASFFAGGAFLVICDSVSRLILTPIELPVGIVTSLLGGPFFLWLLIRSRQSVSL